MAAALEQAWLGWVVRKTSYPTEEMNTPPAGSWLAHFVARNGADLLDEIQSLRRGFVSKFMINFACLLSNVRNIWKTVDGKVQAGQTNNVVINLADSNASIEGLQAQFLNYPISGLNQIIIIDKSGNITIINGK